MRGSTHARTARAAWPWIAFPPTTAALATTLDAPTLAGIIGGGILAHMFAFGPDLDHHNSTATHRTLAGHHISRITRALAGGHRMGTHSLISVAVIYLAVAAVSLTVLGSASALVGIGGQGEAGRVAAVLEVSMTLALGAAVGWAGHIAGDLLNPSGCALFYPLSKRRIHFLSLRCSPPKPEPMRLGEYFFNVFLIATQLLFVMKFVEAM